MTSLVCGDLAATSSIELVAIHLSDLLPDCSLGSSISHATGLHLDLDHVFYPSARYVSFWYSISWEHDPRHDFHISRHPDTCRQTYCEALFDLRTLFTLPLVHLMQSDQKLCSKLLAALNYPKVADFAQPFLN